MHLLNLSRSCKNTPRYIDRSSFYFPPPHEFSIPYQKPSTENLRSRSTPTSLSIRNPTSPAAIQPFVGDGRGPIKPRGKRKRERERSIDHPSVYLPIDRSYIHTQGSQRREIYPDRFFPCTVHGKQKKKDGFLITGMRLLEEEEEGGEIEKHVERWR